MKNMFYIITETYTDIYIKKKNCKNLVILRAVYSGNFCSLLLKEGDACRTKEMKTLLKLKTTKGVNYNLQSNYNQELS